MKKLMIFLQGKTPGPVKAILSFLGIHKFISKLMGKQTTELAFQTAWAKKFRENKNKVLEYWEKYRFLEEIKTIVNFHEDTKVLDVGCGISTVLHFVNGKKYGIDPLAESYKELYDYPDDMNIQKAGGEDISFADEYFDVVFSSNVIDHVTDPEKMIGHIVRVLKKSGFFILTVELFEEKAQRDTAHPYSLSFCVTNLK